MIYFNRKEKELFLVFKPNIGTLNALIRITAGLTMVTFAAIKLTRKPWCFSAKLSVVLGAMKVAEGIVRFCPITEAFKLNKYMNLPMMSFMKKGHSNKQEAHKAHHDEPSHHDKEAYSASDKEIEADIAEAILGTKSF
ncbi:YgaP family membrane protein [Ectobacillus antri]|jgi:hypothetical protein|uniref:YgaP family membrane protein n=1 Tax=Ectobacillus antri TaxID=2486280 RepID=UPI000F5A5D1A